MRKLPLALTCALFFLAGCDDESSSSQPEAKVYASVEACKAEMPEDECQKSFADATEQHDKTAPRYQTQATCEDVYGPGQCVPRHSEYGTNDVFIPYMMGYMMGHSYSGPTVIYHSYPIYVDRGGTAFSRGSSIGTFTRSTPSAPSTVSRGGFGGSAASAPVGLGSVSGKVAISPSAVSRGGFGGIAASMASSAGG